MRGNTKKGLDDINGSTMSIQRSSAWQCILAFCFYNCKDQRKMNFDKITSFRLQKKPLQDFTIPLCMEDNREQQMMRFSLNRVALNNSNLSHKSKGETASAQERLYISFISSDCKKVGVIFQAQSKLQL